MAVPTPLERAPAQLAGRRDVWLKREDVHELGAFKWRGALPVVRALAEAGHATIVTASTGNHGAAVAWACRELGLTARVFAPVNANEKKLALLERLGADVRLVGADLDEAKELGHASAGEEELPFFEDGAKPLQYDAYAEIGDELLEQAGDPPAAVIIPVGNGALAGGIGTALARRAPAVERVGVVAKAMPVMADAFASGRAVAMSDGTTIAEGLAVRVPIPLAVRRLRDALDLVLRVSERAIAMALVACHEAGVDVEPSAAAGIAALAQLTGDGPVVVIVTGRNFDEDVLARARSDLDSFPA
jgi:threonine dehydratase